jgi:hypothetical protein
MIMAKRMKGDNGPFGEGAVPRWYLAGMRFLTR